MRSTIAAAVARRRAPTGDQPPWAAEAAARRRLYAFIETGHAASADRSLADVGVDDSSKLSVALALGSLSPREVYAAVQQPDGGAKGGGATGAGWLASHMEMRDFFVYSALAAGPKLFSRDGAAHRSTPVSWTKPRNPRKFGGTEGGRVYSCRQFS